MRSSVLVAALAALLALSTCACAEPSLLGPSGLLKTPTADALGMAQWNVGGTAIWADEGPDEGLVYGNVGLLAGLELGFTRHKLEDQDAETFINVKLKILDRLPGKISIAVGLVDITDQIDRSPYAVLTHDLGAGLVSPRGRFTAPQVHVGVGSGIYDGLFGGFSVLLGGQTRIILEYDGEEINAGARWTFPPSFQLSAAFLNGLEDFSVSAAVSSPW